MSTVRPYDGPGGRIERARGRVRVDPWRTLAHDGSRRAEVRSICSGLVIDFRYASWGEWLAFIDMIAAINDWADEQRVDG